MLKVGIEYMHQVMCSAGLRLQGSGCIEKMTVSHEGDQCNTRVMQSPGDS